MFSCKGNHMSGITLAIQQCITDYNGLTNYWLKAYEQVMSNSCTAVKQVQFSHRESLALMQETVSGSGISWGAYKSAPRSRQITMPTPHHSVILQARCPSCSSASKTLDSIQHGVNHSYLAARRTRPNSRNLQHKYKPCFVTCTQKLHVC